MPSIQLTDEADVKLYILCIMNAVGYPLKLEDINDLALFDQLITNMAFVEAFDKLEEENLIKADENGFYSVTEDGAFVASNLKSELAGYIHERSLRSALQLIEFRKSNTKKEIEVIPQQDGRAVVSLKLLKDNEAFMDIKLRFDTVYQARRVAYAFSENPESAYARIIAILSGE